MNLYFDNAATTCVYSETYQAMEKVMKEIYGNPSSLHYVGMQAEEQMSDARRFFAKELSVSEKDIYFTSGGTESNNLAVLGIARAYHRSGQHIITSSIEHPSVGSGFSKLEAEGFSVTRLQVDASGRIDLSNLQESITKETILVSIMQVNNEIGTIQDIELIGKIIKEKNPKTLFHVDGVQGFMKFPLSLPQGKIDLYSASSHKIHGPKGIGFLYIKGQTKIIPLQFGGSQQKGIRPGTENVPGIVGFYEAAKMMHGYEKENLIKVLKLRDYFINQINEGLPHWTVNSPSMNFSPYIVSLRSKSIKGEVILHALEDYKISVSTGSACSSKKLNVSHVLKAIGLSDLESDKTIRVSFDPSQETTDIDALIQALITIDKTFALFVRK